MCNLSKDNIWKWLAVQLLDIRLQVIKHKAQLRLFAMSLVWHVLLTVLCYLTKMDPLVVLDEKYIPQQKREQADTGRISKR